jgi:hypothetical protein
MTMVTGVLAFLVGLLGLAIGWRAGRLTQVASRAWADWRGAARSVRPALRGAAVSTGDAARYMATVGVVIVAVGVVGWIVA